MEKVFYFSKIPSCLDFSGLCVLWFNAFNFVYPKMVIK